MVGLDVLFCSVLFCSVLFCSCYAILCYAMLCCSVLFRSVDLSGWISGLILVLSPKDYLLLKSFFIVVLLLLLLLLFIRFVLFVVCLFLHSKDLLALSFRILLVMLDLLTPGLMQSKENGFLFFSK